MDFIFSKVMQLKCIRKQYVKTCSVLKQNMYQFFEPWYTGNTKTGSQKSCPT